MGGESLIIRSIYLQWLLAQVFPLLRKWPVVEWPLVLAKAHRRQFDQYEFLGIMVALVFVTWLLKPEAGMPISLLALYGRQLLLSIPLLICFAGPFYLRRIRRGIVEQSHEKKQ